MTKGVHFIYITIFAAITLFVFITLANNGISYYRVNLEERFYHPDHSRLKSSGSLGHTLGVTGSLCILVGVGTYMVRKRNRPLARLGQLKYWLEFHIFLCVLGTLLVVYHSAFKAGGVAAVSFWSMITVFASGIAGRVIYLRIPRTQQGRELDLKEVRDMRGDLMTMIRDQYNLEEAGIRFITVSVENRPVYSSGNWFMSNLKRRSGERDALKTIRGFLKEKELSRSESSRIMTLVRNDFRLGRTIERLESLKNLFRYWHVFHLPFALLMLIFMIFHVIVTVALGYRWIL